jgi:hypothetical protein
MSQDNLPLYWTAALPQRHFFDSFLAPLNQIIVEPFVVNEKPMWRLPEASAMEWFKIEFLLMRCSRALNAVVWLHLDVDATTETVPWPSAYGIDRAFPQRKMALGALRTVRAVFLLQVAWLSFMNFLNSSASTNWLDKAVSDQGLTFDEMNAVRRSIICNNSLSGSSIERVGLIIDVRAPLENRWQQELEKLIKLLIYPSGCTMD